MPDDLPAGPVSDDIARRLGAVWRIEGARVDRLETDGALSHSHLLPSVRAELLARLDRPDEARIEFARAIPLVGNAAQREVLERKVRALDARHPAG